MRLAWIVGLLLLLAAPSPAVQPRFRTGALEPAAPAPDFVLQADQGKTVRLRDWRGDVVVLYFGYTSCPDICPTTFAELAEVKQRLGRAAERLRVALVTVDPERDTAPRLRIYMRAFDPSFVGLTGPRASLEKMWKAYGVYVKSHRVPGSVAAYAVDHSATTFVIDAQGDLRLVIPFGTSVEDICHDLQLLLAR